MSTPSEPAMRALAAVPAAGDLPLLREMRSTFVPLTDWAPDWLRAALWAALVLSLFYGAALLLLRVVMPWLATALPGPVTAALDLAGKALALPEYLVTREYRRRERPVPAAAFTYGSALGSVVTTLQDAACRALTACRCTKALPGWAITLVMVLGVATWNHTYCADRERPCAAPVSQWTDSVREAASSE